MKRIVRLTALLLGWIVLGAFGGLLLAVGLPNLFHAKSLTVMSGSMEPTIGTGDVVVAQQISPMDARVGDIVSFRDPLEHDRVITHRVRVIHVIKDKVEFVTQGRREHDHRALGRPRRRHDRTGRVPRSAARVLHGLDPLDVRAPAPHRLAHAHPRSDGALEHLATPWRARAGAPIGRRSLRTEAPTGATSGRRVGRRLPMKPWRRPWFVVPVSVGLVLGLGSGCARGVLRHDHRRGQPVRRRDGLGAAARHAARSSPRPSGYLGGKIRQGGQFYVYAQIDDGGNPPAGVGTVTADVSAFSTGGTAVAMTAGAFSVAGRALQLPQRGAHRDQPDGERDADVLLHDGRRRRRPCIPRRRRDSRSSSTTPVRLP